MDSIRRKRIWITWEKQIRNKWLSNAFGAELIEYNFESNRLLRYILLIFKTLRTLIKQKPKIIFAQNPSIVLALLTVTYGKIFNTVTVIDAHNAGVYPFNGKVKWANLAAKYLFKNASLTIVTNKPLAEYVRARGGGAVILPDKLPEYEGNFTKSNEEAISILFICTWANDEPYGEVIKSARHIQKNAKIYITGKSNGKENKLEMQIPENVILTGYLPEDEYIEKLHSSDIVIDLTTRENCLVCGAYEAVSAGKPLITSNSKVLREYFNKGTLYTNNTYIDLAEKINMAINENKRLATEMAQLKHEINSEWENIKRSCENVFDELIN